MNRQRIAEMVLMPADKALEAVVSLVTRYGVFEQASDATYGFLKTVLKRQFEWRNELEVDGAENVPLTGGVLLACNHQSWMDVPVLGVACPRRVHFIAKAEFRDWPVMRQLVPLMQSIFIKRHGDSKAMEIIVDALKQGRATAIFPEGTIPGEEESPRTAVQRGTGFLPGKTGAVRIALAARVPLVPAGISGTGPGFPSRGLSET